MVEWGSVGHHPRVDFERYRFEDVSFLINIRHCVRGGAPADEDAGVTVTDVLEQVLAPQAPEEGDSMITATHHFEIRALKLVPDQMDLRGDFFF